MLLGEIELIYKETENLAADMLTKSLPPENFLKFRDEVMGGRELQSFFLSLSVRE
jgi:hypothetical protein